MQTTSASSHFDRRETIRRASVGGGARQWRRAALGLALASLGAAGIGSLFLVSFGEGPAARALAIELGLGPACLLSGVAQVLVMAGLSLLWTAMRGAPEAKNRRS